MAGVGNERARDLRAFRGIGDALADRLLQELLPHFGPDKIDRVNGLENLLNALMPWTPGSALPLPGEAGERLRAFLQPSAAEALPAWLKEPDGTVSEKTWRRMQNAQKFFQKFELTAMVVLGCSSLPHCYSHPEIASTLVVSGRLASQVKQRLGETADFLRAVMQPEALRDGQALPWIRKVRLMHAIMRLLTLQDASEHRKRRGLSLAGFLLKREWHRRDQQPLDQLELCYVLLTFSLVVLEGWSSLGVHIPDEIGDDYLFTWRVVGHVLGVEDELLARQQTLGDARQLFAAIKALQADMSSPGAEMDGRLLAATLLVLLSEFTLQDGRRYYLNPLLSWLNPWLKTCFRTLPRSLVRRLVDDETSSLLWVEAPPLLQQLAHWLFIFAIMGRDSLRTRVSDRGEIGAWPGVGAQVKRLGRAP